MVEMEREDMRRRVEVERRRSEDEKEAAREKAIKEGEARIRRVLEEEFKARMAKFEEQQRAEREEAERKFAQRIAAEKELHSKALETAMMDAKNEANRTISELNREVVAERGKLVAEQQARSRELEEEWRVKEEMLQKSLLEVEGREQEWQEERAEVLAEVQRLKAEASRMVAILAMEAEEENLSEEKKLSLGQEVYSLQLVVDMRTGEVRSLRQQLAVANQQLESMDSLKSQLEKANARLDDLQAQVMNKNAIEKQLSQEKSQLEMSVDSSNKAVERMSQNVEELQWRIRNNFDLPIVHHENPSRDDQPVSLPVYMPESPVVMRTRPSLPDIPRNNVLLDFVAKEMLPGKAKEGLGDQVQVQEGDTSDFDFSPLTPSDQRIAVGQHQDKEADLQDQGKEGGDKHRQDEEGEDVDEGGEDVCSLDEGLGGISDSEVVDSTSKEITVVGDVVSSGEKDCGDDCIKTDPLSSDPIAKETDDAEQSVSRGSEEENAPPSLPREDPPRNPMERKPSRIPKMIHQSSPTKSSEAEILDAEKGSKEAEEGRMEKGENDPKERAFSPERRPSRISFETML